MQAKAVKALGVLLLMGGLSYGVYEGVKISPTSYMYNSISDVSLLQDLDIVPLTTESISTVDAEDEKNLVDAIETQQEEKQIIQSSDGDSTSSLDSFTTSLDPVLKPQEGTDTVISVPSSMVEVTDGSQMTPKQDLQEEPNTTLSDSSNKNQHQESVSVPASNQDTTASSHGLSKADNYDAAANADVYTDNSSSASKPTTFVEGENPEYIKELWTNSIAIKHRKYWNLSPIGDESWKRQVAFVRKRFDNHAYHYDREIMYGMVFGDFTINKSKATGEKFEWKKYNSNSKRAIYELNAENLANMCYYNMARTPWGTWWGGGRYRFWALMWDFCSKESVRKDGTPANYWYHNQGDRKEAIYDAKLEKK